MSDDEADDLFHAIQAESEASSRQNSAANRERNRSRQRTVSILRRTALALFLATASLVGLGFYLGAIALVLSGFAVALVQLVLAGILFFMGELGKPASASESIVEAIAKEAFKR